MRYSKNWHPFRRWLRQFFLGIINRWLPEMESPAKHVAFGSRETHHRRRRRMRALLRERLNS